MGHGCTIREYFAFIGDTMSLLNTLFGKLRRPAPPADGSNTILPKHTYTNLVDLFDLKPKVSRHGLFSLKNGRPTDVSEALSNTNKLTK